MRNKINNSVNFRSLLFLFFISSCGESVSEREKKKARRQRNSNMAF